MSANETPETNSILVVEDSRIQATILSNKLEEAGFDVRTAENGRIGLDMIHERRPTLVISDIEMPEMTGYQLCEAVKNDPGLRTIPFILLSTLSNAQDIIKGLHCGADNYVTKPYDPQYLIGRVESLLETPLVEIDDEQELDVTLGGTQYRVKAGRQQLLNLLVSTFENAVEKNQELIRINEELTVAKEQLSRWNQELEELNQKLESTNARMSRDLEAAAKVQQSLLPSSDIESTCARFAWKYLPCDELAGDFLNVFKLDERHVAVFVVDVSGHGVASSLLSVTIGRMLTPQASTSSLLIKENPGTSSRRVVPPAEVAFELNQRLPMEQQNDLYFTMVYGILDQLTLEFKFVAAGHPPVVHVPANGKPHLIEAEGFAIGWIEDIEYDEHTIQLEVGDRLYLYSDGIPEAMDEQEEQFNDDRLLEIVELGQSQSLDDSVNMLQKTVQRWCGKRGPSDDVSILALEIIDE